MRLTDSLFGMVTAQYERRMELMPQLSTHRDCMTARWLIDRIWDFDIYVLHSMLSNRFVIADPWPANHAAN